MQKSQLQSDFVGSGHRAQTEPVENLIEHSKTHWHVRQRDAAPGGVAGPVEGLGSKQQQRNGRCRVQSRCQTRIAAVSREWERCRAEFIPQFVFVTLFRLELRNQLLCWPWHWSFSLLRDILLSKLSAQGPGSNSPAAQHPGAGSPAWLAVQVEALASYECPKCNLVP